MFLRLMTRGKTQPTPGFKHFLPPSEKIQFTVITRITTTLGLMSSNKSLLNKLAQLQCANEKKVNLEQCQAKHLRGYPDCFSAADAPGAVTSVALT